MKDTIKMSRTTGYLEKIFRTIDKEYFDGQLEEPIITVQKTRRRYGHVSSVKDWAVGKEEQPRYELNLGAETLNRPIEEVVGTIMHECCHLLNIQNGVADCSRGGCYHNKHFREVAEAHDLKVEYDKKVGWGITEPTEKLIEFVWAQGWTEIEMSKTNTAAAGKDKLEGETARKSTSRKYQCPKCKDSVRATKEVNVVCAKCNVAMEWVNK